MSVRIFISAVSAEFRDHREMLRHHLTRPDVEVKIQEDFKDFGDVALDKLDRYIAECDAVVHLVGDMGGECPLSSSVAALRTAHPELVGRFPPLDEALAGGEDVTYTQWEAWLALYYGKR